VSGSVVVLTGRRFAVKRSKRSRRVKVNADGVGVVSHAGVGMLRELARDTGLVDGVTEALADTYAGPWVHAPGRVFADMAVAIADGADCVWHVEVFGDRQEVCGPVASMPTTWRMLDRIDEAHLSGVRAARAAARRTRVGRGRGPGPDGVAADRPRRHDHDLALRGQGERGQDVETHVRSPAAAGVPGSPGGLRR
jgi:hypothetical protein